LKKTLLIALLGTITSLTVPTLSATIIIAGATGSPDVFGAGTGTGLTLLASTTQTVNPGAPYFDATYTEWVYSDTSGTVSASGGSAGLCQNCLDFFIELADAGPGIVERISTSNFGGFVTDVGYNTAGVAGGPAAVAAGIIPGTVDRSGAPGNVIGFNYTSTNITSGQSTVLLEIETNAVSYTAGTVTVQDGAAGFNTGFSPTSAPEPGTMALLGFGLIGLGMAKVKRNKKVA
jgi:hypothetical protein